jgi:hypothetical protein
MPRRVRSLLLPAELGGGVDAPSEDLRTVLGCSALRLEKVPFPPISLGHEQKMDILSGRGVGTLERNFGFH